MHSLSREKIDDFSDHSVVLFASHLWLATPIYTKMSRPSLDFGILTDTYDYASNYSGAQPFSEYMFIFYKTCLFFYKNLLCRLRNSCLRDDV
jgi:hypothetical protein